MYTEAKQFLGKTVTITMDRPLGSLHPKYGYTYPVNYGFVPETKSPDGGELVLMEIEDQMCLLSLLELSEATRNKFVASLKISLSKHLFE